MKRACWAAPLGDCEGDLERAHLVSDCLWEGDTVGWADWTRDEPMMVGRGALVAKIQCAHHNRILGEVDTVGGGLFKELTALHRWTNETGDGGIREFVEFDGWLAERWFLVTMINKVVRHDLAKWHEGSPAHSPPLALIESAFGRKYLPYPMGLWSCESERGGPAKGRIGMIRSTAKFGANGEVLGNLYEFAFMRLLLWASPTLPPEPLAQTYRQQYSKFIGPKGTAGMRINFGDVPGPVVVTEWRSFPK